MFPLQMRNHTKTSYKHKDSLLQKVDALPPGPEFKCTQVTVKGNKEDAHGHALQEELEIFHRDPVECVHELIGNPAFWDALRYVPVHMYTDATC